MASKAPPPAAEAPPRSSVPSKKPQSASGKVSCWETLDPHNRTGRF